MKHLQMIVQKSHAPAIKARLRTMADVSEKWQTVVSHLLGVDDTRTMLGRLCTTPDGTGPTVALSLGVWVNDRQLEFLRDIKSDLTATQRSKVEVRVVAPDTNTVSFDEWAASQSTPLYRKYDPIEQPTRRIRRQLG